jgi:hypothetical protein
MLSAVDLQDVFISSPSPAGHDLAVWPVYTERNIPVDGFVFEVKTPSQDLTISTSDGELSTDIETTALQSSLESPRSYPSDVLSDTTFEDGEIREKLVGDSSLNEMVVLHGHEDEVKVTEQESQDASVEDNCGIYSGSFN